MQNFRPVLSKEQNIFFLARQLDFSKLTHDKARLTSAGPALQSSLPKGFQRISVKFACLNRLKSNLRSALLFTVPTQDTITRAEVWSSYPKRDRTIRLEQSKLAPKCALGDKSATHFEALLCSVVTYYKSPWLHSTL